MKRIPWLLAVLGLVCSASAMAQVDLERGLQARRELALKIAGGRSERPAPAPLPLGTTELIQDGDFEYGDAPSGPDGYSGTSGPWHWSGDEGVNPIWQVQTSQVPAHSGSWYAYMTNFKANSKNSVFQSVTIPANATATLSFWLFVGTYEAYPGTNDALYVQLWNQSGALVATLATYYDRDRGSTWKQKSIDVSQYAGQTVALLFGDIQNNTTPTAFFVDDVSLVATTSGGGGGGSACTPDAQTLCLANGRFKVQVGYRDYGNNRGTGSSLKLTDLAGYFYFFDSANPEILVKFVSFCSGSSGNWAIYASGLTDVEVTIKVTDTKTGFYKEYPNALGHKFCTIGDGPFTCP